MPVFKRHFVRNIDDQGYFDTFFVSALSAILLVRLYLYLTGFPQVGGKGLHVAHMLWGGLALVVGFIMVLSFLDHRAHRVASLIAGIGFGLFVDELGKFITSDNNYFFRPAIAIIYMLFVGLYLVLRYMQQDRNLSDREYLVNSIETFKEAILHNFDRRHVEKARYYLARVPSGGDTIEAFRHAVNTCPTGEVESPGRIDRLRMRLERRYLSLLSKPWFNRTVIVLFLFGAVVTVLFAIVATASVAGFVLPHTVALDEVSHRFARAADFAFGTVAALIQVAGAVVLFSDRLRAYRLFRTGVLVNILLTNMFVFYNVQFWALITLALNLVTLGVVDTLIGQEKMRRRRELTAGSDSVPQPMRQAEAASPSA